MLHLMAEELRDDWILGFFARGLIDLENYLSKHAAFAAYCTDNEKE